MPISSPPSPSESEVFANSTFESLLWSMSRPGLVQKLPEPGENPVIHALIDRECTVFTADPVLENTLRIVGAETTGIENADHVFLGELKSLEPLSNIKTGSDLYPDEGATLILRVLIGQGVTCRLTGPGVDSNVEIAIDGLPKAFWQKRKSVIRYPMGFDLILIDQTRVVGVPRSTMVEQV